jgi:two-component system response regulator
VNDFDGVEVLLVEDNDSDAEMMLRALEKCNPNNKRYWVKDGAEALAFINGSGAFEGRDLRENPRLILLDLVMPAMSGLEVLRSLRLEPATRAIPVVIMTESNQERDLAACYRLGANGFVSKPLAMDAFTEAVARIGMYWLLVNRIS